ncbi:MAG TPA: hypothetical protein VL096_06140 [Pirellulaceae bacterium]|nr:hypothetical protein [Pirellulaceae bacterium]
MLTATTNLPGDFRAATLPAARPDIQLSRYNSLVELRRMLNELDHARDLRPQTVVIVLDERFAGHLPTLVSRSNSGFRLVLASGSRLPGLVTIGDLAATSGSLGWQQITFERDIATAVKESLQSTASGERFVLCWPAWHDELTALRLLTSSSR